MRFDPCMCPRCGEGPYRILTTVESVTRLNRLEDGTFEFDDSNVSWETQVLLLADGKATIFCLNHHGFQAEIEPEESDETEQPGSVSELEPDDKALIALTLLMVNPGIKAYLTKHDPALLRQARNAMFEAAGLKPIDEGGAS